MVGSSFTDLEDSQFDELLRLSRLYYREAQKCEAGKAHLAGCVMLGAALEAALLATVHCFADEAAHSTVLPTAKSKVKPLLQWRLAEALRVAKDLKWFPSGLRLDEDWNSRRAHVGDYSEVLRHLRNLIHPARYLADHARRRVTGKHLALSFEVLEVAWQHIFKKLSISLREQIEKELSGRGDR